MLSFFKKLLKPKENNIAKNEFSQNEYCYQNTICPYCNNKLHKLPSNKIKCKNCNQNVYCRTSPVNGSKLLLTEEQLTRVRFLKAEKSKQNWIEELCHRHTVSKNDFIKTKIFLSKKHCIEIDDYDVILYMINSKTTKYKTENNWGVYSTAYLDMADILFEHGNLENSLNYFLHVCYLDLNGPMNYEGFNKEDLKKHPPFNPKNSFIAPYVVDQIINIMEKLNLDVDDLKKIFIEFNSEFQIPYINLNTKQAWNLLKDYLC
ncbi:hypothetical protein ACR77J_17340 [Tissierella praeacuta]|uniref:hypothetical protein n=1 Tax=Tissierella praeacuta TaxID=43131 RepID=UPI003DA2BD98